MQQYTVKGMSCAACQAKVEKAVNAVEGVTGCAVSLLTNTMGVEGNASPDVVLKAVEAAGYGAILKSQDKTKNNVDYEAELTDTETPKIKKRFAVSLILLIPLMYVSMGHMMLNFPVPQFLDGNCVAIGIYEMLLAGIIMVINQKFFINGFNGVRHKSPNMDTLVALGSLASFAYSVYALFAASNEMMLGNMNAVMGYMDEFYFESAAMIVTLITLGKLLESVSKGRTTNALKELMRLSPQTAVIKREGKELTVNIEEVKIGDVFVVKPGEQIPVDGVVIEGFGAVNESAFTGESIPVDKKSGDMVSAATINTNGCLTCEATRIGEDTSLAKIIRMVSDAAATKAPIAKIADKVSGFFVPVVIIIAVITFAVWMIIDKDFGYSLARAISVLVISCPCALGLATPVAIMVGNGVGAKSGILFKTAVSLEQVGKIQIVALDKTGTITTGQMQVTDVISSDSYEAKKDELTAKELVQGEFDKSEYHEKKSHQTNFLAIAASLEMKSEHPISKAIVKKAVDEKIILSEVSDFSAVPGNGLMGRINGEMIYGGNLSFIAKKTSADLQELKIKSNELAAVGKTPVFFATKDKALGLIALADMMKEDSREAISQLKRLGIHVVMLTGDNEITASAIAKDAMVDEVVASVKPDGKEEVINRLKSYGKVAMVGDGINDAPALTSADIGMAIGAGTDIAIDAADVVLAKSSLMDVAASIRISRATIKNIYENLFWAFIYNIIGIPLAAGCYVSLFGWSLNPMFGAAAMSLSSFCVIMNALRLNFVNVYDTKKDRKLKNTLQGNSFFNIQKEQEKTNNYEEMSKENSAKNIKLKGEDNMEIIVNGMMCAHCEAHVKKALEKIEGIEEAVANHEENKVTIKTTANVDEQLIKDAIEDAGYEYVKMI